MRSPRYRLRSLMILVLVSALALGVGIQIAKLDLNAIHDMKPRLFLLAMFGLMVVAKFGLLLGIQARRRQYDQARDREAWSQSRRDGPLT